MLEYAASVINLGKCSKSLIRTSLMNYTGDGNATFYMTDSSGVSILVDNEDTRGLGTRGDISI